MARSDRSHRRILGVVAVVVLALVTSCLVWLAFARNNRPVPPEKRPVAVFIGDSYTQPGTWPGVVAKARDWEMVNLARGGTGYVARSSGKSAPKACGGDECPNFVEMADVAIKRKPDVVVVAGGRNDGGTNIDEATHNLFHKLRDGLPNTRIIAVQPMWDAGPYPDFLVGYEKVIQREVTAVDGEYLQIGSPLADHPELLQSDGVHPTTEGQKVLGRAVNKALGQP